MTEQEAILILNAMPGPGNSKILGLIAQTGSAKAVLSLTRSQLRDMGVLQKSAVKFEAFQKQEFLDRECGLLKKHQIRVVTLWDLDYPVRLKNIPDAPVVFYMKGQLTSVDEAAIAVVGTRRASIYGQTTAQKLAGSLGERGITIVSGLARGIDTAAHRGALKAGGRTIAVLGCGLSGIYPSENTKLAQEISEHGAVISEFPMEAPPAAFHFPRRNRIISGLSLGVVVVEAGRNSGALITSDFALEQGREVFAVPGPVDHPNAKGTHRLIQQGAKLVSTADDILEEILPQARAILKASNSSPEKGQPQDLSEIEKKILNCMDERQPIPTEELASRCQNSFARIHSALLRLEIKHLIKQLPGQGFVRSSSSALLN